MKYFIILLALLMLSGCLPIRIVKDLPNDGQCEKLSVIDANGKNENDVQRKLKHKAKKAGANVLQFDPEKIYEVTLRHPVNSSNQGLNGIGTAYKCTYH